MLGGVCGKSGSGCKQEEGRLLQQECSVVSLAFNYPCYWEPEMHGWLTATLSPRASTEWMLSISPALRTFNKEQNRWSSVPADFILPVQLWEGSLMNSVLSKSPWAREKWKKLGQAEAAAGHSSQNAMESAICQLRRETNHFPCDFDWLK